MKITIKTLLLLGLTTTLFSCGESEELGEWTFCECAEIHTDYKGKIATETDPEAREMLELEIGIVEEDCKEFLPPKNATTEEMQAYHKEKANCR